MSIKVKETITLNFQELEECISISEELFGKEYHSKRYFNNDKLIKLLAKNKDKIIGFFTIQINFQNIIIDCIAVKKKWQRKKVGSLFMQYFFKNILENNQKVIVYAWKVKNQIPVHKLIYNFGLKKIINLGTVWKKKCNTSFKCIRFEKSCNCECVLYSN